jgi:transcriptional regulator with XRE-family HTH domain
MIKTNLKLPVLLAKMKTLGVNQATIAESLGVSRESVSQWLSGNNFPRARHLLKLGELLKLTYSELVEEISDESEPVFAFSAAHNHEHNEEERQKVKDIGYALEKLIPYINKNDEVDYFQKTMVNPKNDINYLQSVVNKIKTDYAIDTIVYFKDIIRIFDDYNAYVVPVFWGSENNTSNGIHIKLAESRTDWIYINLDSFIYDIKFWLLHELAHMLAPDFQPSSEAEEFANCFAGEFLFPIKWAKDFHNEIKDLSDDEKKEKLFNKGIELLISPYTIYKQVNRLRKLKNLQPYDIPEIVNSFKNFLPTSHVISVTDYFLKTKSPKAEQYLSLFNEQFNSKFVDALSKYYLDKGFSIGFIRNIFHISIQDAQNIFDAIVNRDMAVASTN